MMIYDDVLAVALYRSSCEELSVIPRHFSQIPRETRDSFLEQAVRVRRHYEAAIRDVETHKKP